MEVSRPVLNGRNDVVGEVLGSPVASIAATMTAESFDRPVSVVSENKKGRWHVIELRLHPQAMA